MMNIFKQRISPQAIMKIQNHQYQEKLLLEDTVPANSSKLGTLNVSSLGAFYCLYFTGSFETLFDDAGAIKDDGVSHLRGKLIDGSNSRSLFNDYIPLDLFLTPGRVKSSLSTTVLTDPVGNSLFYPQPFQYLFAINSDINFDVKNDSDTELTYSIVFNGIRVRPEGKAVL